MTLMKLDATWIAALQKPAGVQPIIEVVIDPDGRNIKLDGTRDSFSISPIITEINIDPSSYNEIILNDVMIQFNDSQEFFNCLSQRGGFAPIRIFTCQVSGSQTATSIVVNKTGFVAGDLVTFTDGTNSETVKLTSVTDSWPSGETLYFASGSLSNTYTSGDIVSTSPILGSTVRIDLRLKGLGCAGTKTVFLGVIRQPFVWDKGGVILKVDNYFSQFLQKPLRIKSTSYNPKQRLTNSTNLSDSDTAVTTSGTFDLDQVTVYNEAYVGQWAVTFTDATNFTVTGPNCNAKAGAVGSDFFDQTDATDSQIKIASAAWGGTWDVAETVTFYLSVNFVTHGPGLYYYSNVAQIVYDLLVSYGEISTDYMDVSGAITDYSFAYSWNYWYDILESLVSASQLYISFDTQMTVGEAINTVLPHQMAYLTQLTDGKLEIFAIRPAAFYYEEYATHSNSYLFKLRRDGVSQIGFMDFYNEIIVKYGWDYVNGEYQYTYAYPLGVNKSSKLYGKTRQLVLEMPAYYSEADAEAIAKRYSAFWAYGKDYITQDYTLYDIEVPIGTRIKTPLYFNDTAPAYRIPFKIERHFGRKNFVRISSYVYDIEDHGAWVG